MMMANRRPEESTPADNTSNSDEAYQEVEGTIADRRLFTDRRDAVAGQSSSSSSSSSSSTNEDDTKAPSSVPFNSSGAATPDTGLERRRGPGRRRSDMNRSAEEGEMSEEQFLFLMAIDAFKRVNGVTYPTWCDIIEILRRLGYRKVQPSQINLPNAEDWSERADAPIALDADSNDDADDFSEAA